MSRHRPPPPLRRPRRVRLTPAFAAWVVLLAACGGPGVEAEGDPALSAHPRISPTPPMVGEALLTVEVTDGGVPAPEGTRVVVPPLGDDPDRRPPSVLLPGERGRWSGAVVFPAAGAVRLEIQVTLPSGRSAIFRYPVTVARRPGR